MLIPRFSRRLDPVEGLEPAIVARVDHLLNIPRVLLHEVPARLRHEPIAFTQRDGVGDVVRPEEVLPRPRGRWPVARAVILVRVAHLRHEAIFFRVTPEDARVKL